MNDDELELQIEDAKLLMLAAQTPGLRRHWAEKMRALIVKRSPERIQEMESARGLR
jgi:hypothetical protein